MGHSGHECDLVSILSMYDLRKGDLSVLSWAMVRRVRRGSISSGQPMCGGRVLSISLFSVCIVMGGTLGARVWEV